MYLCLPLGHFNPLYRQVAAWLSGNALVLINVVTLRRARLVLGWVTVRGYTILVFNQSHPGLLSLPIPPWVGTMSTGGGLVHRQGRNGQFRVTVVLCILPGLLAYWPSRLKALVAMGPAIRLTCVVCQLNWVHPRRLKGLRMGMSSCATDLVQGHILICHLETRKTVSFLGYPKVIPYTV